MNRDVTKGPGDLYDPEDYVPNMDGFEQWLEDLDDPACSHTKLEYLERFITYTRTATGEVISLNETPYGTRATVAFPMDEAFEGFMCGVYQSEVLPMFRMY